MRSLFLDNRSLSAGCTHQVKSLDVLPSNDVIQGLLHTLNSDELGLALGMTRKSLDPSG